MNRWTLLQALIIVGIFISVGCSSGERNPLAPSDNTELQTGPVSATSPSNQPETHLWGFMNTVDFDPDPVGEEFHTANNINAYISRFTSSGNFSFALTWTDSDSYDRAYGIEIDSHNYCYVTGRAYGSGLIDFDPFAGEDLQPSPGAFLSKFDGSGVYYWARTWGSDNYNNETTGYGLQAADSGAIFVVGTFDGTDVNFAPSGDPCFEPEYTLDATNGYDMFIVKYRSDGCW